MISRMCGSIGDIHGHSTELLKLLAELEYREQGVPFDFDAAQLVPDPWMDGALWLLQNLAQVA